MYHEISSLFKNAKTTHLKKGNTLFRTGDKVARMYLVEIGKIDLVRHSNIGIRMILHSAIKNDVLAEASAYSDIYHCDGVASLDTKLLHISVDSFLKQLKLNDNFSSAWAAKLAHALQQSRMNAEIRTLRTVKARVDAWLENNHTLPEKGHWQDLAETLGVTREALYRELAKRRKQQYP